MTAPGEHDWAAVRDVRLAALADTPDAFDSSRAAEQGQPEQQWRDRLRAGGQRLGWLDEGPVPVGLARGVVHEVGRSGGQSAVEHHLVGMWVSPAARGAGVAGALVEAVLDWAREQAAPRLLLWVVGGNEAAHRLYLRHGFTPTGRVQPLPSRPWQPEQQYARTLTG